MPTETPTAPTTEIPGSGAPLNRVPLPEDLLQRIKDKATATAPASQVRDTSAKPIAQTTNEPSTNQPKESKPPEAAKTEPPKVAEAKNATPAGKPATPEGATDGKPKKDGIAAVREALERKEHELEELKKSGTATNQQLAEAHKKVADLEAKVKGYDEKFQKEWEPQIKRLAEKEKRLQEVEEKLRVEAYTKTPQFHDSYNKPIADTHQEALQFIGELVANTDNGQVQATAEHLNYVLGAPNANEAARRAEQLFGATFTPQLVNYRTRLRALQVKREEAVKQATVESEKFFQQQEQDQIAANSRFKQQVQARVNNYIPKPAENDPEEAAAYQAGMEWAETVEKGSSDPEQWADMVARVKASVGGEKLRELRLNRLAEENKNLKAELAKYRASEPEVSTSGKGATQDAEAPRDPYQTGSAAMREHLLNKFRQHTKGF